MFKIAAVAREQLTNFEMSSYPTGSDHMISQAMGLSTSGSLKGTATSLIFSIRPPPFSCDGMPPCTQNIYKT